MSNELAKEAPKLVQEVLLEGQKGLSKDLADAIQKTRADDMKIISSSLASLKAETQREQKDYEDRTQKQIRESMQHFGSNITSMLSGFIKKEHESLEQKDERDYDENDDDGYDDDDRNYKNDRDSKETYGENDNDDHKRSSKSSIRSDAPLASLHQNKKTHNSAQYEGPPGDSSTQTEKPRRMQGKEARRAEKYSDDDESDALVAADETETKALGDQLPAKLERLGADKSSLTQTLDLSRRKAKEATNTNSKEATSTQVQTRTDDDFGLKDAEDTVSKEVLKALAAQNEWPSEERHQHHFHHLQHHHHDEYEDDDY
jgi:hypothetical protein